MWCLDRRAWRRREKRSAQEPEGKISETNTRSAAKEDTSVVNRRSTPVEMVEISDVERSSVGTSMMDAERH